MAKPFKIKSSDWVLEIKLVVRTKSFLPADKFIQIASSTFGGFIVIIPRCKQ